MTKRRSAKASTFEWRALPPMQFARSEPVALLLEDGRLLVVGRVGWNWDAQAGWQKREDLPPEVLAADRSQWNSAADLVAANGALRGVRGILWDRQVNDWLTIEQVPQRPATESIALSGRLQLVVGGKEYLPGDSSPTALDTCVLRPQKGAARSLR